MKSLFLAVPLLMLAACSSGDAGGGNGAAPAAPVTGKAAPAGQSWSDVVAKTAEGRLSDYYIPDEQRARLFTVGAVLAMAVGCLGLYGLASFNTARRTKEIGIRKTLGASTRDVLTLLLLQFLRPVLIANLIAWPLAWFVLQGWLSSFDQLIALTPLYFIGASLLALVVAVLTVVGQALRVARAEPAKALRYE